MIDNSSYFLYFTMHRFDKAFGLLYALFIPRPALGHRWYPRALGYQAGLA